MMDLDFVSGITKSLLEHQPMSRVSSVSVLLSLLASVQAAAQAPFVEMLYRDSGPWEDGIVTSLEFVDLPGTAKTVTVPAGKAVITWSLWTTNASYARVRPAIGSQAPDPGLLYYNSGALSGSWTTNTEGGTIDVRLQAALAGPQGYFGYDTDLATSWTLVVFPSTNPGAPAVSGIGLVVMTAFAAIAGTIVFRRGHGPTE